MPVDRGEPHVRNFVELMERLHDALADLARFHLVRSLAQKIRLEIVHDRLELLGGNGTLLAGTVETVQDLLATERLPPAVLLDHEERRRFHRLVRREAAVAAQALATAADGLPFLRGAGVDDLVLE